nr:hypothetical protein [Tanacetum cinerariifolium]
MSISSSELKLTVPCVEEPPAMCRRSPRKLAIVGNQQQQIESYIQNNTSQTAANVPGGSSIQGTVSLSSDDDIDIQAILSAFEGNDCSLMANNADNKQQQQIAANQQHGIVSSSSDHDDLWSFRSAFDNKRGHQDGQSSSMAKRKRLNPLAFKRIRHNIKQEPLEIGRDSDRLHLSFPPQLARSTFVQAPWNKSPGEFSRGSMEIITTEDDEPVQRRSSL